MGRVGKAYGIGSRLQADSLRQLELTCEAQVHVEEAGTAELVTVRVSIMCIGIAGYHRRSERSGIEEVTAKVCGRAGLSRTKRLPTDLVVGSDEISRLDRSICVQRARRTGHGEGRTGHIADHCTHLPSPEGFGYLLRRSPIAALYRKATERRRRFRNSDRDQNWPVRSSFASRLGMGN